MRKVLVATSWQTGSQPWTVATSANATVKVWTRLIFSRIERSFEASHFHIFERKLGPAVLYLGCAHLRLPLLELRVDEPAEC